MTNTIPSQFAGMNYCTRCAVWFQPNTNCNCVRAAAPWYPPYYPYPYPYGYPPYWYSPYGYLSGGTTIINNDGHSWSWTVTVPSTTTTTNGVSIGNTTTSRPWVPDSCQGL